MASSEPRFRLGFIAPPAVGAEQALRINEEQLLPPDVVRISVGLGISDYTTAGVEEAIGRYWSLVDELAAKGANYIILAGVPISSQLGRERVLRLLEETKRRTGITADSTNEAMIAAMQPGRITSPIGRSISARTTSSGSEIAADQACTVERGSR